MTENNLDHSRVSLVRDLIRTISTVEKKPIGLDGICGEGVSRAYITDVVTHAIKLVNQLEVHRQADE